MYGDRIKIVRNALSQLIDLLPKDSYFNIISFGSNYDSMFPR